MSKTAAEWRAYLLKERPALLTNDDKVPDPWEAILQDLDMQEQVVLTHEMGLEVLREEKQALEREMVRLTKHYGEWYPHQ